MTKKRLWYLHALLALSPREIGALTGWSSQRIAEGLTATGLARSSTEFAATEWVVLRLGHWLNPPAHGVALDRLVRMTDALRKRMREIVREDGIAWSRVDRMSWPGRDDGAWNPEIARRGRPPGGLLAVFGG